MLQPRVIPVLLFKHGTLVRSQGFQLHQRLGDPVEQVERLKAWDVDELVYLDISSWHSATGEGVDDRRGGMLEFLSQIARGCFMPLTVGGGIRSLEDIRSRISAGADRIVINTAAVESPDLIQQAAHAFGSQAVVVSVDVLPGEQGSWEVVVAGGSRPTGLLVGEWAREVERRGAGEILLRSLERDGRGDGYDLALLKSVSGQVGIPVVACGGAGCSRHLAEGLHQGGVSAVAAGNLFNFKELSYLQVKQELRERGVAVRESRLWRREARMWRGRSHAR